MYFFQNYYLIMKYTNLNISDGTHVFKYIVELIDNNEYSSNDVSYYQHNDSVVFVNNDLNNITAEKNYWTDITTTTSTQWIPEVYDMSRFKIYFPQFSVDTYEKNVYYAITFNTWINGKYVYLGSYIINRLDCTACESGPVKFLNDEYYEYLQLQTIDPAYLVYNDAWKSFRVNVCDEKIQQNNLQLNNTGSNINITLNAVRKIDDKWIKIDGYNSSQSAIVLSNKSSNYMHNHLEFNIKDDGTPVFNSSIIYNTSYDSFVEYLQETYDIEYTPELTLEYYFIIRDEHNVYKEQEIISNNISDTAEFNNILFTSWDEYTDGMRGSCVAIVKDNLTDTDLVVLTSNDFPITKEVFKYLIANELRKINLSEIEMEIKKFDVVNRIEKNVITVERPNDYKANIIKPVFIKVQDTENIKLNKGVISHIVINLDAYKNKVNAFTLKVGDILFNEEGRVNVGIIFKIVGTLFPDDIETTGIYYILDDSNELVTTGKYNII